MLEPSTALPFKVEFIESENDFETKSGLSKLGLVVRAPFINSGFGQL